MIRNRVRWFGILAVASIGTVVMIHNATADLTGLLVAMHVQAPQVSVNDVFERYLVNLRGKVVGLQLRSGAIVRVRPRSLKDQSLRAGDVLHINARQRTKNGSVVYVRASVTKNGAMVVEASTHAKKERGNKEKKREHKHEKPELSPMNVQGSVTAMFGGKKGKIRVLVLNNGTMVYAPRGADFASLGIKKGDTITIQGQGATYELGQALKASEITLANGSSKTL